MIKNKLKNFALLFTFVFFSNITISKAINFELTFFFQNYYIGNNLMTPVLNNQCNGEGLLSPAACLSAHPLTDVDIVTVELHDRFTRQLIPGQVYNNMLKTNGKYIFDPPAGIYYIVIKYPNVIQTWSKTEVMIDATHISYNFSLSDNSAFGNNQTTEFFFHSDLAGVPGPLGNLTSDGVYKFYSGDISDSSNPGVFSQDGIAESQDYTDIENEIHYGIGGYKISDLNGDGAVDLLDFIIVENAVYHIYFSIYP